MLIALAILPPLLAVGWLKYAEWKAEQERQRAAAAVREAANTFYIGLTR
jgi:hypothetical protein